MDQVNKVSHLRFDSLIFIQMHKILYVFPYIMGLARCFEVKLNYLWTIIQEHI